MCKGYWKPPCIFQLLARDFVDQILRKRQPLRYYLKKDSDFSKYESDLEAQKARRWIIDRVLTECVCVVPDWKAASRPWESGRPFEGFLDGSDVSWCVALCQRDKPAGTPRLIAFICKYFSDEATR